MLVNAYEKPSNGRYIFKHPLIVYFNLFCIVLLMKYDIKKLLIEAPPAGVGLRKQFCYSRNYNINVVISYIIKKCAIILY